MILALNENKIDSSKLKDFKACPRKFFYSHVLGWRSEMPNIHLVFGSAWHEAMEHLLLNGYSDTSVGEAFDKFLEYYRQYFPPETDGIHKAKTVDNALVVLAKYSAFPDYHRDLEDFKVLFTEIAGSVSVDETHVLYFRMDSILQNNHTLKIRSREHKTGSRTWQWEDQWLLDGQVGTYNHVLYCLYPRDQVDGIELNGIFFLTRKTDPYDFRRFLIKRTEDQMQVWLDTVRYYLWEIDREYELLDEANESDMTMKCFPLRDTSCQAYGRLCEFHDFCMAWPNPLRKAFDPPIGFRKEYWDPTLGPAKKTFEFPEKEY